MGEIKPNGIAKLARVLDGRMAEHSADAEKFQMDFGTIGADGSLITNTFPVPIPLGDYSVCRLMAGLSVDTTTEAGHSHYAGLPRISPGDRVLVAWVQQEPVVIDVVQKAARE